jgi:hypothetical protein
VNALAATGNSQASLMAVFALPPLPALPIMTNTAPVAPVTAAFVNVISLLLSSPNQAPPQAAINFASPSQMASPAKIADAMIRSMLGNTLPTQTAGTAPIPILTPASMNPPSAPVVPAGDSIKPPVATPSMSPPAPRKQMRSATESPMTTIVVPAALQPIVQSPPPSAPMGQDSKAMAPITESTAQHPAATTLPRASSPEANAAFTALLTPIKDVAGTQGTALQQTAIPQTGSPASQNPDAAGQIAGPTEQAPSASPSGASISRQSTLGSEPAQASQALETKSDSQSQTGSGQTSQQHATPDTPVRSASETKIKQAPQPGDTAAQTPAIAAGPSTVTSLGVAVDASRTTPAATRAGEAIATPYHSTAEALRTTEASLVVPSATQARTGTAQEISIRIAPADSPAVDLRVVERSGQIHVDVRTPDAAMQTSLRQDLGALTSSLERAGYHAETFTPSSTLNRAAASAHSENQQNPSQNRGGAGDFSGGRQQQQQKRPGNWLEELEEKP